jgi:hypothetical protein
LARRVALRACAAGFSTRGRSAAGDASTGITVMTAIPIAAIDPRFRVTTLDEHRIGIDRVI